MLARPVGLVGIERRHRRHRQQLAVVGIERHRHARLGAMRGHAALERPLHAKLNVAIDGRIQVVAGHVARVAEPADEHRPPERVAQPGKLRARPAQVAIVLQLDPLLSDGVEPGPAEQRPGQPAVRVVAARLAIEIHARQLQLAHRARLLGRDAPLDPREVAARLQLALEIAPVTV